MKDILVTLGPSSMNAKTVEAISKLDVHLFRINLSHTPLDKVEENIKKIQSWTTVPVCLDSEGAQLRNGSMISEQVKFEEYNKVRINIKPVIGDTNTLSFHPLNTSKQFEIDDEIQVDFNHVKFKIIEILYLLQSLEGVML